MSTKGPLDESQLAKLAEDAGIPAASVCTSKAGQVTPTSSGVTDNKTKNPVTNNTVFEAASLSKPVFAYLVLKLVEQGKFSRPGESAESGLDRPLHEICEFGPPPLRTHQNFKDLTIRQILSHQAGLPNWFKPGEKEDYVAGVGERFDYSGMAYCFLNEVVENKVGKPLQDLALEEFTKIGMGMDHSYFIPPPENSPDWNNRAIGHYENGDIDNREHFFRVRANPAASLFTTSEDYSKFLNACVNDPFVKQHMFHSEIYLSDTNEADPSKLKDDKAIKAGTSQENLSNISWGLGIGICSAKDGRKVAFHWGDGETVRNFTALDLNSNNSVVCLTNSVNGPKIFREVAEPIVGDISPIAEWLAKRENLPIPTTSPTLTVENSPSHKASPRPGFTPGLAKALGEQKAKEPTETDKTPAPERPKPGKS